MSEEKKQEQNQKQYTDIEVDAMDKGWTPKTDWDGDSDLWVDAGEFIRRGELMDRISDQTRQLRGAQTEIKALQEDFKSVVEQNKKIAETEYKKAYNDLKRKKIEALESEEHAKVIDIDERIEELKEARKELDSLNKTKKDSIDPQSQQIPNEVIQWQKENDWYTNDLVMQGAADAIARDYIHKNPSAEGDFNTVLDHVSKKIKSEFSDRFETKRRPSAVTESSTGKSTRTSKSKSKYNINHLSNDQRRVVERMVKAGVMSEQEYVDQLAELGEIE